MSAITPVTSEVDVVIVGSGFGGIAAAKRLGLTTKSVLLISTHAQYLFQPLLYQVATGVLDGETVAPQATQVLRRYRNITIVEGTVVGLDAAASTVTYVTAHGQMTVSFGSLIAATGASQSYFGRNEFANRTFALKTLDNAIALRARIVDRMEQARTLKDPERRAAAASFVVVGAGATGVEVAGQLVELARRHYKQDIAVTLVDGMSEVLPVYGGHLSAYTRRVLTGAGVDVLLESLVTDIDDGVVTVNVRKGEETRTIAADTVIWSAGVQAADFAEVLANATGCERDRAGRLLTNPDLTVADAANIYAIGDMTSLKGYPGQSPVAMQQGRHSAAIIAGSRRRGAEFHYLDKGSMAVIKTGHAVVNIHNIIKLTGLPAFGAWLGVHVYYLSGLSNQVTAINRWVESFVGMDRPGFGEVNSATDSESKSLPDKARAAR